MSTSINGTDGLVLPSTGQITFGDSTVLASSPTGGFKNKIIGGDFTTNPWQRGTSFTGYTAASSGNYTADRWQHIASTHGATYSILKTEDSPSVNDAGIYSPFCLHLDVTTADASHDAGDLCILMTKIEGLNSASFGFGLSGTRYVTLSFWHKHTKTGTYCVSIHNGPNDRCYISEYTQDTTDTWEKETLTIPVDTTGSWYEDNQIGVGVRFVIAAGSNWQASGGAWAATTSKWATANQVNALDSTSNNFKIALVQLEAGSVATPFESRSIGQELALCQRYYLSQETDIKTNASTLTTVFFKTSMRATPTSITGGGAGFTVYASSATAASVYQTTATNWTTLSISAEL